jgi:hypothetical protein
MSKTHAPVRESAVLARVRAAFEADGICYKTTGGGEPDLICCRSGRTIVIETKQPGKKPTKLQLMRLRAWARKGAYAVWTDNGKTMHVIAASYEIPE